jgi:hypothetical protein
MLPMMVEFSELSFIMSLPLHGIETECSISICKGFSQDRKLLYDAVGAGK